MSETRDYQDWHRGYDDPGSGLSWRLRRVRHHISDALDRHQGSTRVLSICSGDGRDLLTVLAARSDSDRVSAELLELHPELAQQARGAAAAAGLARVRVHTVDASNAMAYRDVAAADVVLLVGIFGNVSDDDVWRLIEFAPELCEPEAVLVWSRGRKFSRDLPGLTSGDLNDEVRARFAEAGFSEIHYETHDSNSLPALGVVRYDGPPVEHRTHRSPLFTFLR